MRLSTAQIDRAVGAVLGTAAGDALGAGYEFGPPLPDDAPVEMRGGGQFDWAPGEWTDDTSMSIPILRVVARGERITEEACDELVEAWAAWARTAKDVGIHTRQVFELLDAPTAASARAAAQTVHDRTGRSAGNGSLMRTAPLVLGYLDDPQALAAAAREVSALTHVERSAGDACAIWCLAIRHAILEGDLDIHAAVDEAGAPAWHERIAEAEQRHPRDFVHNGWVVEALQGAWSAIHHGTSFVDAVERAVRGGRDTDTVAAIAGALAGARRGAAGIPVAWLGKLHGWPGLRSDDLERLALAAVGE
jgi:ADP-ribosylglycohydrolase